MDDILKEKISQHDSEAIQQFVSRYKDMVFKTCIGYIHDYSGAQDIAQEVFIKAIAAMSGFKGNASVATWLTRIAMNLSLNFLRDNRKFLKNTPIESAYRIEAAESTQADAPVETSEISSVLQKAIAKLPERQRDAFILFHYNELSYAEMAETLKLSISAVESLLQRARKNLQGMLKHYYQANFL